MGEPVATRWHRRPFDYNEDVYGAARARIIDVEGEVMTERAARLESEAVVGPPEAYQRGSILSGPEAEARKSNQGRRLIKERILSRGKESFYNLTGLARSFPLDPEDLPGLDDQFSFYAYHMGGAEELAIKVLGGDADRHGALLCNRVSSAILAVMLALVREGDRVLSLVEEPRSHPSVQQAVELAGGEFYEVVGLETLKRTLSSGSWQMLAVTPLTPSKYHMAAADVSRAIAIAKYAGMMVVCDDAHMMSRRVYYQEPPTFQLGDVDVAVWSTDKHAPGPRGGAIVARRDLMDGIRAQAYQFGLEAQSGHYVAMHRSMEALDTAPVEEASRLARQAYARLQPLYGGRVYQAGPGVAFSIDGFAQVVMERAATRSTSLAASELSTVGAFVLMRDHGIATLALTGYPGAAPILRLMMHPDGPRLGLARLEAAVDATIDATASLAQDQQQSRDLILGVE